mmetsp:Transcript_5979/g.13324  ORF Transcript_5979/g.13324 Transcript_5979/m.13324 type:complete len:169 (+) Transcript_5979:712-1218(+)
MRKKLGGASELTFSEIIKAFSGGNELRSVRKKIEDLGEKVKFSAILAWLVAEGLVVQLATYYHFLPNRQAMGRDASLRRRYEVSGAIREKFLHFIREEDLELLADRSQSNDQLEFLCLFVKDFALAHHRTDGHHFATLTNSFAKHKVDNLLAENKDIFVPYVCQCPVI